MGKFKHGVEITVAASSAKTVALMLHGFGTDKNEVNNFFVDLAGKLESVNISSLRVDFRGFGDNEELKTDSVTINTMVEDAWNALNYLKGNYPEHNIVVIGYSLGAYIGSFLGVEDVASFVGISPVNDAVEDLSIVLSKSVNDLAQSQEETHHFDLIWRTIDLKPGFFKSLSHSTTLGNLKKFKGDIQLVAGEGDFSSNNIKEIQRDIPRCKIKIIAGADHTFNCFDEAESSVEKVITYISTAIGSVINNRGNDVIKEGPSPC